MTATRARKAPTPGSAPLAYSLTDAAATAGLSKSHLLRCINDGSLRARRSGVDDDGEPVGKYVILAADLVAYLGALPEA